MTADEQVSVGGADLGIVLVHGLGEQRKGQVLAQWGDALLGWMLERGAHCSGPSDEHPDRPRSLSAEPVAARIDSSEDPAHVEVQVVIEGVERRWLMVESWWADSFVAPTFSELLSWSAWTVPTTLVAHAQESIARSLASARLARSRPSAIARYLRLGVMSVSGVLLALALSPVLVATLAATLALAVVPLGSVRSVAGRIQRVLARSIGDSLALLDRPIQAAAILHRVRTDIRWATDRSSQVVVVAHSQGAAIALEVLKAAATAEAAGLSDDYQLGKGSPPGPRMLVTFGSGVNKLWMLRRFRADVDRGSKAGRLWAGSFMVYAFAAVGGLLWRSIATSRLRWVDVYLGLGVIALTVSASVVWGWFVRWLFSRQKLKEVGGETLVGTLGGSVIVAGWLAIMTLPGALGVRPVVAAIYLAGWFVGLSVIRIFGRTLPRESVDLPLYLQTWIDVYSSRDPVPNGKTTVAPHRDWAGERIDVEIMNVSSQTRDHSWYWKNTDGFIPVLVRELVLCCQLDPSLRRERTFEVWMLSSLGLEDIDMYLARKNRKRRVRRLIFSRWLLLASATASTIWRWEHLTGYGRTIFGWSERLPEWVPLISNLPSAMPLGNLNPTTVGMIAVAALAMGGLLVLRLTWTIYDSSAQHADVARLWPREAAFWAILPFNLAVMAVLFSGPLFEASVKSITHLLQTGGSLTGPAILGVPVWMIWAFLIGLAVFPALVDRDSFTLRR